MANGVWVFAEQKKGKIASTAFELLAAARTVADSLSQPLTAVLFGSGVKDAAVGPLCRADIFQVVQIAANGRFRDVQLSRQIGKRCKSLDTHQFQQPVSSFIRLHWGAILTELRHVSST